MFYLIYTRIKSTVLKVMLSEKDIISYTRIMSIVYLNNIRVSDANQ